MKSYNEVKNIKKEFETASCALNKELILDLCNTIISLYKCEIEISDAQKETIRMEGRGKKFSIISKGSPSTTKVYYGDSQLPNIQSIVVSGDVKNPALNAEIVFNLNGSNCDLEVDLENMGISFGTDKFKLVLIK
jgi:hypothetical protein